MSKKKIVVADKKIDVLKVGQEDYICLSDMVQGEEHGPQLVALWLRNKNTISFLAVWERLNNPETFDEVALDELMKQAGTNSFILSPQRWIEETNAVGIVSKRGRFGGVYAHRDIAFEFAAWLSPEFKLYLIKEFQRLKELEAKRLSEGWDTKRELAKVNYKVHTDAVKNHLLSKVKGKEAGLIYATEADLLNQVVFGCTAQEFKAKNPNAVGNLRDHASVEQLLVLANLETVNALYIEDGKSPLERMTLLAARAEKLMSSVSSTAAAQRLRGSVEKEAKALKLPEEDEK